MGRDKYRLQEPGEVRKLFVFCVELVFKERNKIMRVGCGQGMVLVHVEPLAVDDGEC